MRFHCCGNTSLVETLGATGHVSGDVLRPAVVAAADLPPPAFLEIQGIEFPMDGRSIHASLKNTGRLVRDPKI